MDMYQHLNARTRELVGRLTLNESLELGGQTIAAFSAEEATALSILAQNLRILSSLSGRELAEKVVKLLEERKGNRSEIEDAGTNGCEREEAVSRTGGESIGWRIGWLRACSFRGLAPAGREWKYDFDGKSHLLYGPNGCGKSSLLGAISWCLTGRIFRDDCAPSVPENVKVFPVGRRGRRTSERPDALALLKDSGESSLAQEEYWVEIELIGTDSAGDGKKLWIRRHSADGLATSPDGAQWGQIETLGDAGIDELDGELHILMPARVGHLRFGKNAELIHVLSQVVGLDDLEAIADLADRVCRAVRTEATNITGRELAPEKQRIAGLVERIEQTPSESVTALPSYAAVSAETRELKDVQAFGKALAQGTEKGKKQLASDLGIEIAREDTPEYIECREKLDNLPGQVQDAIDELTRPLCELFPESIGFEVRSEEEVENLQRQLVTFESDARKKVSERLQWGLKEKRDAKASLMLVAAEHFPEQSSDCPVCTQDLGPVPEVREQLETLRALVGRAHLKKEIDDLERALVGELGGIICVKDQQDGEEPLCQRILSGWRRLKDSRFRDFLSPIAERFDVEIQTIAERTGLGEEPESSALAEEYHDEFPDVFGAVDDALRAAKRYLWLCLSVLKHSCDISSAVTGLLVGTQAEGEPDSLRAILERGRSSSQDMRALSDVSRITHDLESSLKKHRILSQRIARYRSLADLGEATKALGRAVRTEVIEVVKSLESQMKEYFSLLYDNEILVLKLLTTGHPANANIRDEINVYLRAADELIPMGPFSNQGRTRALILSLVFALLEKSKGSLEVLVLDDPALSLDDDHKARFVDRLVSPFLAKRQVILATHYEKFYKQAERVFIDAGRLMMAPRRNEAAGVSFEAGDLLERVECSLESQGFSWREMAIDLRRWCERALATLSSYCPQPFAIFNNIPDTVTAYADISDRRVATRERDLIVKAFESPQFCRVKDWPAHDEETTQSDVRDGLGVLKGCQKAVEREIRRLKALYRHDLLGRALEERPSLEVLSLKNPLGECQLEVVGTAAAAHNGVGVSWGEHLTTELAGLQAAIVTLDTISPIAQIGQCLLLDPVDNRPHDGDLVVVETDDGRRYLRRFWVDEDGRISLEGANPTAPYKPVALTKGKHSMRRIVGVLLRALAMKQVGDVGSEWVCRHNVPPHILKHVVGVRVKGDCLGQIARDGQVILVQESQAPLQCDRGELVCIDAQDTGAIIKRCYPSGSQWLLCAANSNELERPIEVPTRDITHAYKVVGVLFELNN